MYSFVERWVGRRWATVWLGGLLACSPADNWRQLSWPQAQLSAQFPCKPDQISRGKAHMAHCDVDGVRFAVSWQALETPELTRAALQGLIVRFDRETQASGQKLEGPLPAGAMAWSESGRYAWSSMSQSVRVMAWAQGLTVYQATVLGTAKHRDAIDTQSRRFFDEIRSSS